MDEMAMLRELGRELEHEPPATLARQRSRLGAAPPRRTWRRVRRRVLAVGALAVVTTMAITLVQTMRVGGGPALPAAAAEVLNKAADAAAREPEPRPDQFVFVHFKEKFDGQGQEGTDWISVDGSRVGLMRRNPPLGGGTGWGREWACDEGDHPVVDLRNPPRCKAARMYRDDLPTDPDRMLDHLYKEGETREGAWEQASDLMAQAIAPRARAALFRALAKIPGATVNRNAVDAAGRRGVGVRLTSHDERSELIFDPRTYAFLGRWSTTLRRLEDAPAGQVGYSVLLETGYVDKIGELPH